MPSTGASLVPFVPGEGASEGSGCELTSGYAGTAARASGLSLVSTAIDVARTCSAGRRSSRACARDCRTLIVTDGNMSRGQTSRFEGSFGLWMTFRGKSDR